MTGQSLREQKSLLRRTVQKDLARLSEAQIASQSASVTKQVLALEQYQNSMNISIFLSMPGKEVSTSDIVLDALRSGKSVFVPYIRSDGSGASKSMEMLQIEDEADLRSLQPDAWGIPSLLTDSVSRRRNALGGKGIEDRAGDDQMHSPNLDLIFMPAVAFDRSQNRLGHGKGYYDRYLQRYHRAVGAASAQMPLLVGLGLRQQLLSPNEVVPHAEDDWKIDLLVVPVQSP